MNALQTWVHAQDAVSPLTESHIYVLSFVSLRLQWFRSVDKDGTGQINCVELQAALAKGNLHFSLASVAHMYVPVLFVPSYEQTQTKWVTWAMSPRPGFGCMILTRVGGSTIKNSASFTSS
eukprot:scaffold4473_cov421-Prasinococcus_capsulatus_cf.AAC.3